MKPKDTEGVLYAVYGTLRKGFHNNNRYLENEFSEYLGTQILRDKFRMVSLGGFPGVIPIDKDGRIIIEVFRVKSKNVEHKLDLLEGYPEFYGKVQIKTRWGVANMYTLTEEKYGKNPIVENGDWKEYYNSNK
jgi:gamma-glutamylcyclotransferase (GGCT)/AIG2-like uncharacterized protein YtfP